VKYIKIIGVWLVLSTAGLELLLHLAAPYGPHQLVGRLPYQAGVHVVNVMSDTRSIFGPNPCNPVSNPLTERVDFTFDHNGGRGNASAPILVLGDSFVADGGSNTPFWASIDAYGLGQNGAGPLTELALLKKAGFNEPRKAIIVAFFAGNDISNAAYEQTHRPPRFLLPVAIRWVVTNHDIPMVCYTDVQGQPVALYQTEIDSYRHSRAYWEQHAGWTVTQDAIRSMRDLSLAHGALFILLYIPTKTSAYAPMLGFGEDAQRGLLEDFARRENIAFWDLTEVIRTETARGTRLYWHGDLHWNPVGHTIIGEWLKGAF